LYQLQENGEIHSKLLKHGEGAVNLRIFSKKIYEKGLAFLDIETQIVELKVVM